MNIIVWPRNNITSVVLSTLYNFNCEVYPSRSMKKILISIIVLLGINSIATSKETTFTNKIFEKSQLDGKTVVIHSWNKTCITCAEQVKILEQAKKDFKDTIFLSFEQTKDKQIAKFLDIAYWTTIVVYENNKEISRSIGQTNKEEIYTQIKSQ